MNIQDLKSNTTWQEASNTINNNNNKISLAIATLENAKLKNKGYFTTVEKLNEAVPNPTIGSKAYVGTSEPYAIYIVENGVWVDSGYTGGDEIVANITTERIEDGAVTIGKLEPSIQSLITNISKNASFAGIATPTTNPGTPEGPVFYLATKAGTYANFGEIEVIEGEASILQWSNGTWSKKATGLATQEKLTELEVDVNGLSNRDISSFADAMKAKALFLKNNSVSVVSASAAWHASDYMEIATGYEKVKLENVRAHEISNYFCAYFFDNNKSYIGHIDGQGTPRIAELIVNIPNGARFIRVNGYDYDGYVPKVTLIAEQSIGLKERVDRLENVCFSGGDYESLSQSLSKSSLYINKDTKKVLSGKQSYSLEVFDIVADSSVKIELSMISYGLYIGCVALINTDEKSNLANNFKCETLLNGNYLSSVGDTFSYEGAISGGKSIVVSSRNGFINIDVKVEQPKSLDEKVSENRELINELIDNIIPDSDRLSKLPINPLERIKTDCGFAALFQKWGFVGDSFLSGTFNAHKNGSDTYLVDYKYSWGQYICRLCGTEGFNFSFMGQTAKGWINGTSGGGRELTDPDKIERTWVGARKAENKKDVYIIAMGCNDCNPTNPMPIGNVSDIDINDFTNNADSFYGNYAGIIQRLFSVQPKAKIFCVTLPSGDRPLAESYNVVIRKMAELFDDVFIIDLYNYAPSVETSGGSWNDKYRLRYHLSPMGYIYTAYEIMTYIDWIIRSNPSKFKDVAFIGTEYTE